MLNEWTVMVYLAGDNNLSEEMIYAIKEMYRVGVNRDFALTIQFDPSAIGPAVRRYEISREKIVESIAKHPEFRIAVEKEIADSVTTFEKIADLLINFKKIAAYLSKHPGVPAAKTKQIANSLTNFKKIAAYLSKHPGVAADLGAVSQEITDAAVDLTLEIAAAGGVPTVMNPASTGRLRVSGYPSQTGGYNLPDFDDLPVPDGLDLDGLIDKLKVEVKDVYPKNKRLGLISTGEINSANPTALRDFIAWSIRKQPAERYMLVLSGHGSGAIGDFLRDENALKNDRPTSLSIPNLGIALDGVWKELCGTKETDLFKGGKIHILGMDSCLMSMIEVGYELRDSVEFLVGSEGAVLNTGWPYHRILELLQVKPAMDPEEFAKSILKSYISYYDDYEVAGASTDMSVCNLGQFQPKLRPKIEDLAKALIEALDEPVLKDAIVLAHWEAQSYKAEQYTDLFDFCERLQLRCIKHPEALDSLRKRAPHVLKDLQKAKDDTEILQKTDKVLSALPKDEDAKEALQLVIKLVKTCEQLRKTINPNGVSLSCYSGPAFQHSHGLSVFFPWFEDKEALNGYGELAFANKHAIVMQEGATGEQIRNVVEKVEEKHLIPRRLEGDRSTSIIVENGEIESSEFKYPGVSRVLTGTGWAMFLRKYLDATRRERRNERVHNKKDVIRIDPPVSATLVAPIFLPFRSSVTPRGLGVGAGSMKNPPDGFYRDKCHKKKS
jgi:hypothetical protein